MEKTLDASIIMSSDRTLGVVTVNYRRRTRREWKCLSPASWKRLKQLYEKGWIFTQRPGGWWASRIELYE